MKRSAESPANPGLRILLVNENRDGSAARKTVLEQAGYQAVIALSPEDALAEINRSSCDLVVTSYRMPGINGAELIAKIREIKPAMPIVLLSGFAEVLGLNEQNTGADAVISKSAHEVSHLLRTVNRLLRTAKAPRKPAAMQRRLLSRPHTVKLG